MYLKVNKYVFPCAILRLLSCLVLILTSACIFTKMVVINLHTSLESDCMCTVSGQSCTRVTYTRVLYLLLPFRELCVSTVCVAVYLT